MAPRLQSGQKSIRTKLHAQLGNEAVCRLGAIAQLGERNAGSVEVRGSSPRSSMKGSIMAHHKRKGPKSTRSGRLMCKWYKDQAFKHSLRATARREWKKHEERAEAGTSNHQW